MRSTFTAMGLVLLVGPCAFGEPVETAQLNGILAQEALVRSRDVVDAYVLLRDPVTGLLPRNEKTSTWYVRDSAADLYPFLVMASYYTDRPIFTGPMQDILRAEIQHSMRVGKLSDNVLAGGGFERDAIDMEQIIFGSTEYAKDGLLPLTELMGHTAWFERMVGIADDLIVHAPYDTPFGKLTSVSTEVNGEFLQVLTRLAYLTGDQRYVDQAMSIARFYFEEVIPKSNGLPPHVWDLEKGQPETEFFNFADHGNELVGGLSEFVLYLKVNNDPTYPAMAASLSKLVHLLLDVGLNEDGVWFMRVAWKDHSITDARHAHCWGYLFNAVYTTYLITGDERFLEATQHAMRAVSAKTTYLDDPDGSGRNYKSNAYSDALESAIVFQNRMPMPELAEAIDAVFPRFLRRQREDGIIEYWYGDGNYVRTSLMYAFMKSQGCWVESWRDDIRLGAVAQEDGILLTLDSDDPWQGRLRFDRPRHKIHFHMPINYTRLNEFPEWFTVEQDALYEVTTGETKGTYCGGQLVDGIPVVSSGGETVVITVKRLEGPPY